MAEIERDQAALDAQPEEEQQHGHRQDQPGDGDGRHQHHLQQTTPAEGVAGQADGGQRAQGRGRQRGQDGQDEAVDCRRNEALVRWPVAETRSGQR